MKTQAIVLLTLSALAANASAAPSADREAILAMQGSYDVDFNFNETTLLAPGYERSPAYRSAGSELVILLEDGTDNALKPHIVLQHILVDPRTGHVTKHWRQDWTWEATHRFEFTNERTWQVREIPRKSSRGAWTQCVYEVDDAPRYCGTGRWLHEHGVSMWVSDPVWRPLPRREYTRRDDYNALLVTNRHIIVPGGWTHEQDNTKVRRTAAGAVDALIAHEVGFNDYRNDSEMDFSPAVEYWQATRDYWKRVREQWARLLAPGAGLQLRTGIDGMALIEPLFKQASQTEKGEHVDDAQINREFSKWVAPL